MLGFNISYPDLIKSPFFTTSLEEKISRVVNKGPKMG
jgi:hypothetical protein